MKPNMKTVKETWSIVKIREYIKKNSKKLSSETLAELYDIIGEQKIANEKFLHNLINSDILRLAYKALCMKNIQIQDMPLGEFLNDEELLVKYAGNILDNMITIKEYFSQQDNCSKIAKIRWEKDRKEKQKLLTQH